MQRHISRVLIACSALAALCLALFLPVLPWSTRCRHAVHKACGRVEMKLAAWRGNVPRLASVTGSLQSRGIQIEALDSQSGWATLADNQGRFVLLDVTWYPGARYDLILDQDARIARHFTVTAPDRLPENGLIDIGSVSLDETCELSNSDIPGLNSVTYLDYDSANTDYYRSVFQQQAADMIGDERKLDALNRFVATKLNYEEGAGDFESARRTLERGSRYCGCLSVALAAIAEAGNYEARVIDLCDGRAEPRDHAVVELYYGAGWHLYDPYYGVSFNGKDGSVASYRDLRLNTDLLANGAPETRMQQFRDDSMDWLRTVYASGIHHFYYFKKTGRSCALWWPFHNGKGHHAAPASALDQHGVPGLAILPNMDPAVTEEPRAARSEKGQDAKICKRCEMTAQRALRLSNKRGATQTAFRMDRR